MKINVYACRQPGAFGHLLTNVRGAAALFPEMLLVEELVGGGGLKAAKRSQGEAT